MRKFFTLLLALAASVGMSYADPVSPVTAARFLYTYDCQRNPAYPKQGSPCTLRGFSDPYVGYNGIGSEVKNTPFGPWKLEFAAYYTPSNNYGCESVVRQAVNQYYSSLSNQEKEAKRLEVPIFRLWQYNIVAGEYQHAAYGIVCAYADEGNAEDHGALFISSEGNGCFLAGKPHNAQISLSCENDLTTGLDNLVTAASATDPDYDAYMPVILSIDAIGTVELTQHCKDFIEGSSSAYNALTDAQKGQVTNYQVLVDAKNQWDPLVAEAKPYADAVVDLINAIPNPIVYTQSCQNKIDAAQNAYDALTSGQKIFVSNYETLKNAPSDLMKAAPYVHILFKANGQERKVENVTLPREFTEAEMTTMLKELYSVEGDYDMYAYSYDDAVDISGGKWTINPFMGTVNVNGDLNKFDPETGMDMIPISLEISLELPPYDPEPVDNSVKLYHNFYGDWMETEAFGIFDDYTSEYAKISMILEPGDYQFALKVGGELRGDGTAFSRDKQACILAEGFTANMTLNVDVKGTYRFYWFFDENRFAMDVPNVCGMYWKNVTDDKFEVTLGKESEVTLPKVFTTNMGFATNIFNGVDQVRLVSTDETVATIEYTISMDGLGTITIHKAGECDIYAVHDITDYYCYDSVAFHLTVLPEPTPTIWTSLSVGDVIKVGDKIEVPAEGDGWGINGYVLRNTWGPYTLIRADIYQASDIDDPVVYEDANGAFYVFKAENSDFYPLSNIAKGVLVVTGTSDGLEIIAVGDYNEYTVAVHEKSDTPTAVENVQGNIEQAIKLFRNGQLYIQREGVLYTVQGARVR